MAFARCQFPINEVELGRAPASLGAHKVSPLSVPQGSGFDSEPVGSPARCITHYDAAGRLAEKPERLAVKGDLNCFSRRLKQTAPLQQADVHRRVILHKAFHQLNSDSTHPNERRPFGDKVKSSAPASRPSSRARLSDRIDRVLPTDDLKAATHSAARRGPSPWRVRASVGVEGVDLQTFCGLSTKAMASRLRRRSRSSRSLLQRISGSGRAMLSRRGMPTLAARSFSDGLAHCRNFVARARNSKSLKWLAQTIWISASRAHACGLLWPFNYRRFEPVDHSRRGFEPKPHRLRSRGDLGAVCADVAD